MPAAVVFTRLLATRNHERLIPFTSIRTPDRPPRVGDVTRATSLWVLVDTMTLVHLDHPSGTSPGRATWRKTGPVLLGEAEIVVTPLGPTACEVAWIERDIHVAGLPPRLTAAPITAAIALMTRYALRRLDRLSTGRRG